MKILITGSNGQDGRILYEILRSKHEVYLMFKNSNGKRIVNHDNIFECEISNTSVLMSYILDKGIQCVLNTAAISSVSDSWRNPEEYFRVNYYAVKELLSALVSVGYQGTFYQFGSTDMFGQEIIENIRMNMRPWSPYGESKARAHEAVLTARSHGLSAYNLVLTNHDSNLRTPNYIMKKIALDFAAQMYSKNPVTIEMYNPEIIRDWADAFEICDSIAKLIDSDIESDLLLATGTSISIRKVIERTANELDSPYLIRENIGNRRVRDLISVSVEKTALPHISLWNPINVGHLTLLKMIRELVG